MALHYCLGGTTLQTLKLASFLRPVISKTLMTHKPPFSLFPRALSSPALQTTPPITLPEDKVVRPQWKAAIDFKWIRDNKADVAVNIKNRNSIANLDLVLELYDRLLNLQKEVERLRAERNAVANKMKGKLEPSEHQKLIEEGKNLKEGLVTLEEDLVKITDQLQLEAQCIPNMTHPDVPIGDEDCSTLRKIVSLSHTRLVMLVSLASLLRTMSNSGKNLICSISMLLPRPVLRGRPSAKRAIYIYVDDHAGCLSLSSLLRTPQNGNVPNGETKLAPEMTTAVSISREPEYEETPQKSLNDKQQENQDLLIKCISQDYPALLFKQQLTAFLEKIYGMIRDNLKKEISPLLGLCIQAPRTSRASLVKGRSTANATAQQALIAHWQSIVKSLNNYLKTMKANYVPPFLVRKVFTQIFSFVNVQLFNSLLLRRECCSFSNGEYVKSGLAELEQWCCHANEEYAGSAWDELKHIRQAVGFLVIHQKPKKTLNEITNELCPVLSIQQLYRISTMYWDDKYGTHSVSSDVISSMRVLMTEDSNNAVSSSFLLDDDSSIPFSVDDISKSMQQVDIADIEPPPLIRENSGFVFLHQRSE